MDDERLTPMPETPRPLRFEEVCAANARNIVQWLRWFRVPPAQLGDASQEVFRAILEGLTSFDPAKGDLRGWIYGITRNVGRSSMRRERRALHVLLSEDAVATLPSSTPENIVKQKRDSEFLWSVIENMEESRREVITAHLNGLTPSAIVTALGIPLGTCKTRFAAAKREIQEAFIERDRDPTRLGVILVLPAIDDLLDAERARLAVVPPEALAQVQAALAQVLSEVGGGPASGPRKPRPQQRVGDGEKAHGRVTQLRCRLRRFGAGSGLGVLAMIAPAQSQAPEAPGIGIVREAVAVIEAPTLGGSGEAGAATAWEIAPVRVRAPAGHGAARAAPGGASALARMKMEAAIRAAAREEESASRAIFTRTGPVLGELEPGHELLQDAGVDEKARAGRAGAAASVLASADVILLEK
jgi:RNA polymerase sigma-70 factor (ECF subfamily)